jgi:NAD-reducing hydrogenase small subunit
MDKIRVGTIWLDACSGCHMSFLDMDEYLLDLHEKITVVYGPLVDSKTIPDNVDLFLVSGSVSTDEDIKKAKEIRKSARYVVSLGDCAVTGNVPSMRNLVNTEDALKHAYEETADCQPQLPKEDIPRLLKRVRPLHEVIKVDEYIQGCPPSADLLHIIISELVEGRIPGRGIRTKFG